MPVVEIRCPVGPRKLFMKLKLGEEFGGVVSGTNLFELTCNDCGRRLSRERDIPVRVLHRFNFVGELVSTSVVVREDYPWYGTEFAVEDSA